MRKREKDKYREALEGRRQQLIAQRVQDANTSREGGHEGGEDYIDYAVSSYAKEFLLSLSDLERKQLVLVDEALRRLDTKDFGHCRNCNDAIDKKRLNAAPWARYCIPCQELEEQGLLNQRMRDFGEEE